MFVLRFLSLALGLLLLGGCACRQCCPTARCCTTSEQMFDCRATTRQAVTVDVAQVRAQTGALSLAEPRQYCALEEQEAQCLAATNASIANLMVREAAAVAAQPAGGCLHGGNDTSLTQELLRLEAIDKRNESASGALQVFWRLVEAEGGAANLVRREREIEAMLQDIGQVQLQGLLAPVTRSDLEIQRATLWHQQAEVHGTITKLNYQLQDLLGVELVRDGHFWPVAAMDVTTTLPDGDSAVSLAMQHRADLAALQLAASSSSGDSTSAARTMLQLAGGGLGIAPTSPCCLSLLLLAHRSDCEGSVRSQQLCALLSDQQRTAKHETLQAVAIVATRLTQIGVTKRRLELAQAHVQSIEAQLKLSTSSPLALRKARLEVLAAEQDLLHDVIEWKIALVKLKEAQGLLAEECGYTFGY